MSDLPSGSRTTDAGSLRYSTLRLSRRLRRRGQYGLTASQISALTTIDRRRRIRLGELTRLEQVAKSSMTRMIARLEVAGYITREVDPEDRRGFIVAITELGTDVLRVAIERQDAYLAKQIEALDPEDRKTLLAAIPVMETLLEIRA